MLPQGYGQQAPASMPGGMMPMAQQVQQAQMQAMQQAMPQGYAGGTYTGYGFQGYAMPQHAASGSGYNSWTGQPGQYQGGFAAPQSQVAPQKGFGKGGKAFGKGKGKGFSKGSGPGAGADSRQPWDLSGSDDPRRQIELAQRKAKQRDREAIIQAQRSALQRFERDHMERLQGRWYDATDPNTTYTVDGPLLSVAGGEGERVFRNRLAVFNGDICWDARRFWHKLNVDTLPPVGEEVQRVEWTPGEGSAPTKPVVWQRTPPDRPPAAAEAEVNADAKEAPDDAAKENKEEGEDAAPSAEAPAAATAEEPEKS